MNFLLAVVGALLLLLSLAGTTFGAYMALDAHTREPGVFFAIWWVPAVAAAGGILMRDSVTFAIGALCFVVAGAALAAERRASQRPARGRRPGFRKQPRYESVKRWFSDWIEGYRKTGP